MSQSDEPVLDDASIENPWERMERLGGSLEVIARNERADKVTEARRLLESLEQRIKEGEQ